MPKLFKGFTGIKWAKGLDLDIQGRLKHKGLLKAKTEDECFRIIFSDGFIRFAEWYKNGRQFGFKFFIYDGKDRLTAITLGRKDKIVDTWHYAYGKNGLRIYKAIADAGSQPHSISVTIKKARRLISPL